MKKHMKKHITLGLLILMVFNTKAQTNKIDIVMEPKILLIGRSLDVMEILKNELAKFDRNIVCANSTELIEKNLNNGDINLIVIGAGLPDETRDEMENFIKDLQPQVPLYMIERTPDGNPAKMIDFTNEKAVLWKVEKIIGKMPAKK